MIIAAQIESAKEDWQRLSNAELRQAWRYKGVPLQIS